jgi:hypothetical protein
MTDEDIKRGKRKIVVLNTANRVFCKVQEVINRDKYARDFITFYSIATGPSEHIEVIIETPNRSDPIAPHHRVMHRWSVQLLLDLMGDADRIIESKVLQLMQHLFAASHGVADNEQ